MNIVREYAGCAVGPAYDPIYVCQECEHSDGGLAESAARTDIFHDGVRRECELCGDLFTGPFTGAEVECYGPEI